MDEQKSEQKTDLGDVAKAALNFKFVQSSVQDRFHSLKTSMIFIIKLFLIWLKINYKT